MQTPTQSKVQQAKERCGYEAKPVNKGCGWVKTDRDRANFDSGKWAKVERNLRCTDHGFATKKTAVCKMWRPKPVETGAAGDVAALRGPR